MDESAIQCYGRVPTLPPTFFLSHEDVLTEPHYLVMMPPKEWELEVQESAEVTVSISPASRMEMLSD